MPSPAFQKPIKALIKHDIHSHLKSIVEPKKDIQSEYHPEFYGSLDDKQAKLQQRLSFAPDPEFIPRDRFGNLILVKKPIEEVPGPGYYNDDMVKPYN